MSFSNMHLVEVSMCSLLVLSVSVRVYYRITVHLSVLYPYLYQRYARIRTHPTRVPVPVLRLYLYPLDGRRRVLYCDKYHTYDSEVVLTQPYACNRAGSPPSDRISRHVVKVCARSTKNELNLVLQNVPLSSLASIKELKAYLRSHLNLGVVTAVG